MDLNKYSDIFIEHLGSKEDLLYKIEKAKSDLHVCQVINLTKNLTKQLGTMTEEVLMPKLILDAIYNDYNEIEDFKFTLLFRGLKDEFPEKDFYERHRKISDDISQTLRTYKDNIDFKYIPNIESDGRIIIRLNYNLNENNQKLLSSLLSPNQLKEIEVLILNSELSKSYNSHKKNKL